MTTQPDEEEDHAPLAAVASQATEAAQPVVSESEGGTLEDVKLENAQSPPDVSRPTAVFHNLSKAKSSNVDLTADDVATAAGSVAQIIGDRIAPLETRLPSVGLCSESAFAGEQLDNTVYCHTCGDVCEKMEMANHHRCNRCNSVRTKLRRIYGTWPLDSFREVSQEEKRLFYKTTKGLHANKTELVRIVDEVLERSHSVIDKSSRGGTYLPLSVLQSQGFDVQTIQRECLDVKDHPLLGKTYNVNLLTTSHEDVNETKRSQRQSKRFEASSSSSSSSSTRTRQKAKHVKKATKKKKSASKGPKKQGKKSKHSNETKR